MEPDEFGEPAIIAGNGDLMLADGTRLGPYYLLAPLGAGGPSRS
jgi:hypothetical protein